MEPLAQGHMLVQGRAKIQSQPGSSPGRES